jgi:tetratricopeptide (TPR) repeat protein
LADVSGRKMNRLKGEALHHLRERRPDEALAAVEQAVAVALEDADPDAVELSMVYECLARVHIELGDIDDALAAAREMLRLRIEAGREGLLAAGRVFLSNILVRTGELAEAEAELVMAVVETAREVGARHAETRMVIRKLELVRRRRALAAVPQ